MLLELSVRDLALIEDARVELRPGYCAWTGETGAGKSLLLTALGLVLGQKGSADLIREDREEARAAAVFEIGDPATRAEVEEILGCPLEDDQLVLQRRITIQGRSFAHANGMPVTVAALRKLGERLIDVHGQHETRALMDPEVQRDWLDAYGGLSPLVESYRGRRSAHEELRRKREELIASAERRRRERDLLQYECEELDSTDPKAGEYEELGREGQRLANAQQYRTAVADGYRLLYEADHSAQGLMEKVARGLERLKDGSPELAKAADDLGRLADEVREVAYTLRDLGHEWQDDPERLEEVEARLAKYRKLAARFRCEPDELAERKRAIREKLAALERDDEELALLDAPMAATWKALKEAAAQLTAARRKVVKDFAREVQGHLRPLALGEARISVEVTSSLMGDDPASAAPSESGADRVEIVFAPNPGEPPRPLRKSASGGELARVTLAIKTVLAGVVRTPTLIFDEIDTGVGGRLGAALGRKLAELAQHHQVICVTHLPQMASFASHQWVIRKRVGAGRTRTTIALLDESERVEELAVMLRGDTASEGTRHEAHAMLVEARAGA